MGVGTAESTQHMATPTGGRGAQMYTNATQSGCKSGSANVGILRTHHRHHHSNQAAGTGTKEKAKHRKQSNRERATVKTMR